MKDFNEFKKHINKNSDIIINNIANGLEDVSESQRTITAEEWTFIQKFIINSNIELLNQYHEWLQK